MSGYGSSSNPSAPPYQSWQPGQTGYGYVQSPPASAGMSPAPPYQQSYGGAAPSPYNSSAPSSYNSSAPSSYHSSAPSAYNSAPSSYNSSAPSAYNASAPSAYNTSSYGGSHTSSYGGSADPNSYGSQQQWAQSPSGYPYGYPPQSASSPYGQPNAQFPPGTDSEIIQAFQSADRDHSGTIDDYELQSALSKGQPFSLRTVHLMLHLFANGAKRIGPAEFATLWKALREWRGIFERFDRDRSGRIDSAELRDALLSLGYAVPPSVLQIVLSKYDKTGQAKGLDYDNFVECGLVVKGLTEKFKEKDTRLTGSATVSYETFMLMVLPFIVA